MCGRAASGEDMLVVHLKCRADTMEKAIFNFKKPVSRLNPTFFMPMFMD